MLLPRGVAGVGRERLNEKREEELTMIGNYRSEKT